MKSYKFIYYVWKCFLGNSELAKMLIRYGANVNLGDSHGVMPLHIAAEKGIFCAIWFEYGNY